MRYTQIRNMLDRVRDFHGQLAAYYRQLSSETAQQRVKMLLDCMSTHEKNLQESLAAYEDDASRRVLDGWTACKQCEAILATCEQTPIAPEMSVDGVIRVAMDVNRCLLQFYREVAGCVESEAVRDVFRNLVEMEEAELRRLAINAFGAEDI